MRCCIALGDKGSPSRGGTRISASPPDEPSSAAAPSAARDLPPLAWAGGFGSQAALPLRRCRERESRPGWVAASFHSSGGSRSCLVGGERPGGRSGRRRGPADPLPATASARPRLAAVELLAEGGGGGGDGRLRGSLHASAAGVLVLRRAAGRAWPAAARAAPAGLPLLLLRLGPAGFHVLPFFAPRGVPSAGE